MTLLGWILLVLSVFLIADAILSIIFGKLYMMWGLEYTPTVYRDFITRLSTLPSGTVLGIKLGECVAGLVLFLYAFRLK
jgi:hypothetical protein